MSFSLCSVDFYNYFYVTRPAGIPVVPIFDDDEPIAKRKVQRLSSPEKWEVKQVNVYALVNSSTLLWKQYLVLGYVVGN